MDWPDKTHECAGHRAKRGATSYHDGSNEAFAGVILLISDETEYSTKYRANNGTAPSMDRAASRCRSHLITQARRWSHVQNCACGRAGRPYDCAVIDVRRLQATRRQSLRACVRIGPAEHEG